MQTTKKHRAIIAVTGASGSIYAQYLIKKLNTIAEQFDDCGIVLSENAKTIWNYELANTSYMETPYKIYDNNDLFASFASGSAAYNVMIICPCSMGTLAKIASGIADNLITRTADVMLKEKRKLICVVREAPFSLIHINNMKSIAENGGIIFPANPSFYQKPINIDELINQTIDRILNLAGFTVEMKRWGNY